MTLSSFIRCVALACVGSIGVLSASGQKQGPFQYLVELDGMDTPHHQKAVRSAIDDQDPHAKVSLDVAAQLIKVRTVAPLDPQVFRDRLASFNIVVLRFIEQGALHAHRAAAGALPGFPIYFDTGNPAIDQADYQERKDAWIAAHPEHYPPATEQIPADEQ